MTAEYKAYRIAQAEYMKPHSTVTADEVNRLRKLAFPKGTKVIHVGPCGLLSRVEFPDGSMSAVFSADVKALDHCECE